MPTADEMLSETDLATLRDAGDGFESLLGALLASERFTGWMTLPLCEAVVRRSTDNVDAAMEWLRRLTPLLSSEFAARKVLARHG